MTNGPLLTRNTSSQSFVDFCHARGIAIEPIARRHGKVLVPGPGYHIEDFNMVCDLFEELALVSKNPHFGMDWAMARPQDFRHAGPVPFLFLGAKNRFDFIEKSIAYINIFNNGLKFLVSENAHGNLVITCDVHPLAHPCQQYLEHFFVSIAQIAFRFMPDLSTITTTFHHAGDASHPVYKNVFRGPVIFNAPADTMTVDLKKRDLNRSGNAKFIQDGLDGYIDFQLNHVEKQNANMSVVVANVISGLFGGKCMNIETVAHVLNIQPKKLQRLLAEENTNFSNILREVRKSVAGRYLLETEFTLTQIAAVLDYASQETFIQAFQKWFDQTPSQFRAGNSRH